MKHIFWFQHNYKPIKVSHGRAKSYDRLTNYLLGENIPATLILEKCKCGSLKTQLIEGFHTLEEIVDNE